MATSDEDARELVQYIDEHGKNLTAWEIQFIESNLDCEHFTEAQKKILLELSDKCER